MARTIRLLALLPPGSVAAEVGRVQQAVFAEVGHVSAIALPPLVPVRFLSPQGRCRLPEVPGRDVVRGWRAVGTGLRGEAGHLFLGLDTRGAWGALAADERYRPGDGAFPAAEGFFLGRLEPGIGVPSVRCPPLAFTSADLAVIRAGVADEDGWWREVSWEIEDRRPLRGRREPPSA